MRSVGRDEHEHDQQHAHAQTHERRLAQGADEPRERAFPLFLQRFGEDDRRWDALCPARPRLQLLLRTDTPL
jgi:hypothetical protein